MPRRVYTYADGLGLNLWNMLSTIGAFVFAAGVLLFTVDAIRTWRRAPKENENPWGAGTLEWLPNDNYATRSIPQVESREPLWARPTLPAEVVAGQHWLPGNPTGQRETIVTSPRNARPMHLMILPGDGWLPVLAGFGTAGFFLLLTAHLPVPAVACGLAAIVATVVWLWGSDRPATIAQAEVGRGLTLQVGAVGWRSHSLWAVVILVIVDATVFASYVFAHIHVSMLATVCPPPGAALPTPATAWGSVALCGVAGFFMTRLARGAVDPLTRRGRLRTSALVVAAALASALAFALLLGGHLQAGLAPSTHAWSATVGVMLGWQGFHMAVLGVMAIYLVARIACGHVTPRNRATLDNIALFWRYVMLQGIVIAALVQLLPGFM